MAWRAIRPTMLIFNVYACGTSCGCMMSRFLYRSEKSDRFVIKNSKKIVTITEIVL